MQNINQQVISKLIAIASSLLISGSALATTAKPIDDNTASNYSLSYTDAFVNAMNKSLVRLPQPPIPQNYGACDCQKIAKDAKNKYIRKKKNDSYDRLMQSQFIKNAGAVAGYKLYQSTKNKRLKNYLKYMVGIAGYWELAAANAEKKLLQPVCGEGQAPDLWRRGIPTEGQYNKQQEMKNFAALSSTLGDLVLGVISSYAAKIPATGTRASYSWGQAQEGFIERNVTKNCSGVFLTSAINPDNILSYDDFKLHLIPQFVWIDFTIDFLSYDPKNNSANIEKIIARGEEYIKQFAPMQERSLQLMNLAYERMYKPNKHFTKLKNKLNKENSPESGFAHMISPLKIGRDLKKLSLDSIVPHPRKHKNNKITKLAISTNAQVIKNLNNMQITHSTNESICNLFNKLNLKKLKCKVPGTAANKQSGHD